MSPSVNKSGISTRGPSTRGEATHRHSNDTAVSNHAEPHSTESQEDEENVDFREQQEQHLENTFEDHMIPLLPFVSPEELGKHEEQLQQEFRKLSREYIVSRQSRIKQMLSSINYHIRLFEDNDKSWTKIFNFELETIENIKNNIENLILSNLRLAHPKDLIESLDEYELELSELFGNIQSPLEFDEVFHEGKFFNTKNKQHGLPFQAQFEKVMRPYEKKLRAISNENSYQTNLIKSNVYGNQMILWKQYYNELLSGKTKLINQTYQELDQLYKEYHHIDENQRVERDWKKYHRSVVSINDLKPPLAPVNQDNYYGVDNRYFKNNRIELTQIRKSVLGQLNDFEQQQEKYGDSLPDSTTKLNSCAGLTTSEIDQDLWAIRGSSDNNKTQSDTIDYHEPQSQPTPTTPIHSPRLVNSVIDPIDEDDEDDYDYDFDDDDDGDDDDDDEPSLTPEEQQLVFKYIRADAESLAFEQRRHELNMKREDELTADELVLRKYNHLLAINPTVAPTASEVLSPGAQYSYNALSSNLGLNRQFSTPPPTSSHIMSQFSAKRKLEIPDLPPLEKFPRLSA